MNKNLHSLLFIAVLLTFQAQAQTSQTPIAHWMMDGNAADSSGFGNHGSMTNVTATTGRTGLPNTALFFNGQGNSYISVPNNSSFNVPEFSLCATVKPTAFYNGKCQVNQIFGRGSSFSSGAYGLMIYDNAYDGDCNIFDSTREVFAGNISTNMNSSSEHYWQYTPTVQTNTWYSVVMTYDGSLARIYVNGIQKSSQPVYLPIGSSTEGIYIGMSRTNDFAQYPYPFTGAIDDIALYNRVLSSQEIFGYNNSTNAVASVASLADDVQISPNPAHDVMRVRIDRVVKDATLTVYNSLGQQMTRQYMKNNTGAISVAGWPAGQYMIQLAADGSTMHSKLVVE